MRIDFPFVAVVHVFLEREGKILMMRRCNTSYMDGYYGIPAGHMNGNETPKNAAMREALEEVNIHISPEDLHFATVIYKQEQKDERFCFFFTASKWEGEITNIETDKCDDLSWFAFDNLPENTIPYIRTAIQNRQAGIQYHEVVI